MIRKENVAPELVTELLHYLSASVDSTQACFWKRYFLNMWSSYGDLNIAFSLWQSNARITMIEWSIKAKELVTEINDDQVRRN